jgi:DNA-binding transcriptional MerR regulator
MMKGAKQLMYTVKEVALVSGVTVKTLHHYHRIGLLLPAEISEAGYRLYGKKELERLQQILLYRELDLTLEQIGRLLEREPDRMLILAEQEKLLLLRRHRLDIIIATLRTSIISEEKGEPMEDNELFKGLESKEAWGEALQEQREHLKEHYDYELPEPDQLHVQDMNEAAAEAATFMAGVADGLSRGVRHDEAEITQLIGRHLAFLGEHGHPASPKDFAAQTKFFLGDDFHLRMLEDQQIGLAYYLSAAAESYAARAD